MIHKQYWIHSHQLMEELENLVNMKIKKILKNRIKIYVLNKYVKDQN